MTHDTETLDEFWRGLLVAFSLAFVVYLLFGLVAVTVLF